MWLGEYLEHLFWWPDWIVYFFWKKNWKYETSYVRIAGDRTLHWKRSTSKYKSVRLLWTKSRRSGRWVGEGRLGIFEFAIAYRCDTYAELHSVQDGAPSQFVRGLATIFLIGGLGVGDLEIGFRVIISIGRWQTGSLPTEDTWQTGKTNLRHFFPAVLRGFWRKSVQSVPSWLQNCVCKELGPMF